MKDKKINDVNYINNINKVLDLINLSDFDKKVEFANIFINSIESLDINFLDEDNFVRKLKFVL